MTIVCGTDFSVNAEPALAAARALAARLGEAEVWLVHAMDPALASSAEDGPSEHALRNRLEATAVRLSAEGGPRLRVALERGSAAEVLLDVAQAHRAALVVVASRGHGRSSRFRLGGNSERVAAAADVPVLVVRDATPFVAWAEGTRPLRVLLGVGEPADSEPAVEWVKRLRAHGACDVVAGRVYDEWEARRRYGLGPPRDLERADPEVERLVRRDLERFVGDLGGAGTTRLVAVPRFGMPGDHVLSLAEAERADLVVLGTGGKRGLARWTSVTNLVLHDSHSSVAVVPRPAGWRPVGDIPPLRRVLVATDLSAFADHAIPFAYALLADRGGGEVFLAHVVPPGGVSFEEETEITARLRALVPPSAEARGVVTRTEIVRGADVPRALSELAERLGADLVCVASHGRGGLGRVALGSVAEAMLRRSRRPVMVVRPPGEE